MAHAFSRFVAPALISLSAVLTGPLILTRRGETLIETWHAGTA
jgi:hypothetical protein